MRTPNQTEFHSDRRDQPAARSVAPGGSASELRYALEAAGIGIWHVDVLNGVVARDACLNELLGFAPEENQQPIEDFIERVHPDDRSLVLNALDRALKTGQDYEAEVRIVRPDGEMRWVRDRGRVSYGAHGGALHITGAVTDITDIKGAEERLRASEARFRAAAETASDLIYEFYVGEGKGRIAWFGDIDSATGHGPGAFPRTLQAWEDALHPEDRERASAALAAHLERDVPFFIEYRIVQPSGAIRIWTERGRTIRDAEGRPMVMVGAITDVTEQRAAEAALRAGEERLRLAVQTTGLGIWDFDLAGRQQQWSPEFEAILGLPSGSRPSTALFLSLVHPDDRALIERYVRAAANGDVDHNFRGFLRITRNNDGAERWIATDGQVFLDQSSKISRFVGTIRDVTEQKCAEEQIRWIAEHDALTGLPNRALLKARLTTLQGSMQDRHSIGLLLLDLDDFKQVNDTLGHDAGDAFLCAIAERLQRAVRPIDTVARLGGDEFAIALPEADEERLRRTVAAIRCEFSQPLLWNGKALDCRASIGAALYPDHDSDPDNLLKNADIALYTAKAGGSAGLTMYRPEMRRHLQHRVGVIRQVRQALAGGLVTPYYQPKVCLKSGRLMGFEALLRWLHPTLGLQTPLAMASAFEDYELAVALSDCMLDQVIGDMRRWLEAGIDFDHVAVNASAAEFKQEQFAQRLIDRLQQSSVPTSCLEIEVTESVFVSRGADSIETALRTLGAAGVTITLDDFGTGYASLTHLKQFPVDCIKIDRSFVRDIGHDADASSIVRAVINLGQNLNIATVAEGIETAEQMAFLREHGCDFGQGYLIGRPIDARRVPSLIKGWISEAA